MSTSGTVLIDLIGEGTGTGSGFCFYVDRFFKYIIEAIELLMALFIYILKKSLKLSQKYQIITPFFEAPSNSNSIYIDFRYS